MLITVFVYIYYSAALRVLIITLKLHSEERKTMHSWYQTSRQNSTSFNHKCKYKFLLCFKFDVNEELLLNILYVKVLINIKNKKNNFFDDATHVSAGDVSIELCIFLTTSCSY